MKKVLDMSNGDAKAFFLKNKSYFSLDLPPYFDFNVLLETINKKISGKDIRSYCTDKPSKYEDVNFKLYHNKDGKYDWRPFELIHPVLYVNLVNELCEKDNWKKICKRFKEFQSNKKIICCSIPCESNNKKSDKKDTILNWWNTFEQKSISLALEYNCMAITDITNCYGSIYTHSIAWAIETKPVAKANRDSTLLGNKIDKLIQEMSYQQTNGIPQGSVLMDFIAEMVLGYGDEQISKRISSETKIKDYKILRYRDDYRIFAQSEFDLNDILKIITEELTSLNFKLNANKTIISDDIITNSIKKDKADLLLHNYLVPNNLQKSLFNIRSFSLQYPNSGSLLVLMSELYNEQVKTLTKRPSNYDQCISILVEIMMKNPKAYGMCILVLSTIFKSLGKTTVEKYINKILKKFKKFPNTSYIEIWLQRLTITQNRSKKYSCALCEKVYSNSINIWNSNWLNFALNEDLILDENIISSLAPSVTADEVDPFAYELL
ncbi:MAG: RNA-directed DNA polymerase [Clostridia bacterium]|nr:RNA-directed DNA polymerase [Clostridia bacterium]